MSCPVLAALALTLGGGEVDKTGIHWSLPFATARERATTEHRLLLIKPIAFGTEKNGCW
jgi:hypothetical protein